MRLPVDRMLRDPELKATEYKGIIDGFQVAAEADGSWRISYEIDKNLDIVIRQWGFHLPLEQKNVESAKKRMFAALAKARAIKASL